MNDRDRLDRMLTTWTDEAWSPPAPAYLDGVLATTRRTRQRPAWASIERWLPMELTWPVVAVPRWAALALTSALLIVIFLMAATFGGPSPSPAGRDDGLIAVDSEGDILVARPDGSDTRVLIGGPDRDINPSWSPDMSHLAFWSTPASGGPPRLAVVAPDGSDRHEIEAPPGWVFQTTIIGTSNIAWSPDSSRVVTVIAGGTGKKLAIIETASGTVTPLDIGGFDSAEFVVWSPSGEWIAFVNRASGSEAKLIRPDGSDLRSVSPVSSDTTSYLSIDWSPDSRWLTYTRVPDGGSGHAVFEVDVVSGVERLLLVPQAPTTDYWWPTFSPDGRRIAVGGEPAAVRVLDADGASLETLVTDPITSEDITWSPDGVRLMAFADDLSALLVVPAGGGGKAVRIETPGAVGAPSWASRIP